MPFFDVVSEDIRGRNGRKWTKYGSDVIAMWIADSDFHVAPAVKEAIIEAVRKEDFGYGDDSEIRAMMAEKIEKRNGFRVDPDGVYVTQGILPAMWLACRYSCEPGDEVVVTDPMYYPFFEAIEAIGAKPVYWKLSESEGYRFDADRLIEIISPRTKLVFICNPHNPTGRAMTREELLGLADVAIDNNLSVMSDELWEDVVYDGRRHISVASLNTEIADRTMTAFGFSKIFSVAGLQIGYLASTNKTLMEKIKKIGNRVLRGTSTLSFAASKVMLSGEVAAYVRDALEHLRRMRDLAFKQLNDTGGVRCNQIEATYLAFPRVEKKTPGGTSVADFLLEKAKVAVEDGSKFGPSGKDHIRINFGTGQQILTEGLLRIRTAFDML